MNPQLSELSHDLPSENKDAKVSDPVPASGISNPEVNINQANVNKPGNIEPPDAMDNAGLLIKQRNFESEPVTSLEELSSDGSASAFEGTEAIDSKDEDLSSQRKAAVPESDPSGRSDY